MKTWALESLGSHLESLKQRELDQRIRSKLVCSIISANIVMERTHGTQTPLLTPPFIMDILHDKPQMFSIQNVAQPYKLRVTAMDANHCPGSVMFLFEKLSTDGEVELRILYTGDFR